ncbi:MAG TPA: hypothetical protein PKY50_11075 [Candidatus Competibacter sp.]|nr:hypothetical protein [Candidatus Competibacter sp.]
MGTKATDQLIGHYLDAARFMLFAGEVREMFPQIKSLNQRLYALHRFVHVLSDPDRGSAFIADRWVWSKGEVSDWETTPAHETQASEITKVIKKFNDDNPGYRLKAGSDHRDLKQQIHGWKSNPGVQANAPEYLAKVRVEIRRKAKDGTPRYPDLGDILDPVTGQHVFQIGHGGLDLVALSAAALLFWPAAMLPATIGLIEAERFQAVARFVEFLKKPFKGSVAKLTVAAPGLSAHGTGRAIDFRVHDSSGKKLHGAGGAAGWRSSGFAAKLKSAMSMAPHFHGPLASPDEPWHYFFDPES